MKRLILYPYELKKCQEIYETYISGLFSSNLNDRKESATKIWTELFSQDLMPAATINLLAAGIDLAEYMGLVPGMYLADIRGNNIAENIIYNYSVPDSVLKIGSYAFFNSDLQSITMTDNVQIIEAGAFSDCDKLQNVKLSDSLIAISQSMFSGATALPSITLPSKLQSIEPFGFYNCASLGNLVFPNTLERIHHNAFCGCTAITELVIPDSVNYIGADAFFGCASLKKIKLSDTLRVISSRLFARCSNLTEIVMPTSLLTIASDTVYGCKNLTDVYFNGSLARWKAIRNSQDFKCNIHCSDGTFKL